ncbi:MAG: hypothetical protein OXC40_02570 [Proteobacteria bacterium]|nr:hypothetical protein [Pseudomonadota bacterium]
MKIKVIRCHHQSRYEEQKGYLEFPSYFTIEPQVIVGRISPVSDSRGPASGHLFALGGNYHLDTPLMQNVSFGAQFATGELSFSTGRVEVPFSLSLNAGFATKVYRKFMLGGHLYFGHSLGRYFENVAGVDITSKELLPGTMIKADMFCDVIAYDNLMFISGVGYSYVEYSIGQVVTEKSGPNAHEAKLPENKMLRLHFPHVYIGVSFQLL